MENNIDKICRSPFHSNPSSIFNCIPLKNLDDIDVIERHYDKNRKQFSVLYFYRPEKLYVFSVTTTDGMYLNFWFAKRSYISLYYSALITPHTFMFYYDHFPFALLSHRVALANRPYYMKGGQK